MPLIFGLSKLLEPKETL